MVQRDAAVLYVKVFITQGQKKKMILFEAHGGNKELEALQL